MANDASKPVIIRKIIDEGGHGHHGGAWKVAYADFVTAMMAFFLLLWLLATASDETLKGLAEFFSDAYVNRGEPGGVGGLLDGVTVTPFEPMQPQTITPFEMQVSVPMQEEDEELAFELDLSGADGEEVDAAALDEEALAEARERLEELRFQQAKAAIEEALEASAELRGFKEHIKIDRTPEGLRIQLIDHERSAMFPSGSAEMYPTTRKLLEVVAKAIRDLPNKLSIRGHTDARPFAPGSGYDNWRLSADRANAVRKVLLELGIQPGRIAEVVGKADTEPLIPEDPYDARNRRISLVLLNLDRREERRKAKRKEEERTPPAPEAEDLLGLPER